jgi:hypothetical protein
VVHGQWAALHPSVQPARGPSANLTRDPHLTLPSPAAFRNPTQGYEPYTLHTLHPTPNTTQHLTSPVCDSPTGADLAYASALPRLLPLLVLAPPPPPHGAAVLVLGAVVRWCAVCGVAAHWHPTARPSQARAGCHRRSGGEDGLH